MYHPFINGLLTVVKSSLVKMLAKGGDVESRL